MVERRIAEKFANEAINIHLRNKGWKFGFNNRKRSLGICFFDKKEIQLSLAFLSNMTVADMRETVLHEIAHAIVGPDHGHDQVWKETARRIGCKELKGSTKSVEPPKGKWNLFCGECGNLVIEGRHRRSNMSRKVHVDCGGSLYWVERKSV